MKEQQPKPQPETGFSPTRMEGIIVNFDVRKQVKHSIRKMGR